MKRMHSRSIPDRWLDYTPHGIPIDGTRFVALKVPLKEALCYNLPRWKRFSPQMWMRKHPDVDLIIDLTNTHRYYNYQELISRGKQYKKIKTAGRIVPDPKIVQEFFDTVDDYIRNCENSESFIGVHCTHGVNRTGFFICSYMIRRLGFHPQQAIRLFEEARGHKIERNNYIQALLEMTPEFS